MENILSNLTVSVTELKKNFSLVLNNAENAPVAVLNHNKPEAYLISANKYEEILTYIEDLEDAKLVNERSEGPFIEADIDDI